MLATDASNSSCRVPIATLVIVVSSIGPTEPASTTSETHRTYASDFGSGSDCVVCVATSVMNRSQWTPLRATARTLVAESCERGRQLTGAGAHHLRTVLEVEGVPQAR